MRTRPVRWLMLVGATALMIPVAPAPAGDDESLTSIYVVPMKGQMGTDIHSSIYEKAVEDILDHEPDVIIFVLESSDTPDLLIPQVKDSRESRGMLEMEDYRKLVRLLKDELSDIRQVMWIKDSVGFSSMLALSWDELYMAPDARLAGLRRVIDYTGVDKLSDEDVRAKMSAAITALVMSFVEQGGYGPEIADAMLWPEKTLSASFKGREVIWSPNMQGEFVVDSDGDETVAFRAKTAEDLLISDGTVETLDDLVFLLGYREYRMIDGRGAAMVEKYVDRWRKVFKQTKDWYDEYNQYRGWASGEDAVKYLGRAKRSLERIIAAMRQYKAVELRWQVDMGTTKMELEIEVEKLREQIRGLKKRGGGYSGSNRGGGMAPGGG